MPLLSKSVDDLTIDDLAKVRDVLKLDVAVTPELRDAGIALLKGENIHSVADMIKSPDSVQKLMSLFAPPVREEPVKHVVRCPHCTLFFMN